MYVIGKTGAGKSTLLETMIKQDLAAGAGLAVLDPHGDLVEKVLWELPLSRSGDLIYFNVPDPKQPLGFNPLEAVSQDKRPLAVSGLIEVFKKIWSDSWGPRLEHILRNVLVTLFEKPDSTLADVLRLLNDKAFRKSTMFWLRDPQVREFWQKEFESYPARLRAEVVAPIQNKVGAFLSNPLLRNILVRPKSSFKLRPLMDEGKILLVNLAKGKIGEDTAALLGALIVSRIGLAGLTRTNIPEDDRRDFYVYLDEFQNFTTLSLANNLSELRKYGVNMILANQFLAQLDPLVREAILGNVGTIISFRLGSSDAELLEKEFYPEFTATDLTRLPNYHVYLKLMVDGHVSTPFSATTMKAEG